MEYNAENAKEAQSEYCERMGLPDFTPRDGRCFSCRRNIYEPRACPGGAVTGISVEKAGSRLITGCPHCRHSFCD